MSDEGTTSTPALDWLNSRHVPFTEHRFQYLEKGGTKHSSSTLNVPEREVIKTLVMASDTAGAIVVLMHGDCQVNTEKLSEQLKVKKIRPVSPDRAFELTGYQVGGTSPFGLKTALPIYFEKTILQIPMIYINGGDRGFLVRISTRVLVDELGGVPASCQMRK